MLGTMVALMTIGGLPAAALEDASGLVSHYTFDEAAGEVLHDRTGHGHDGRIVGAAWVEHAGRAALRFGGRGAYVDFGDDPALKLRGDATFLAWVYLDASSYPDDTTNWAIVDCEEYGKEGFIVRIDGAAANLMYRACQSDGEQAQFGSAKLANHAAYLVAVTRQGDTARLYVDGVLDAQFAVKEPGPGAVAFKISSHEQSFCGLMYELCVFDRALSSAELAGRYWAQAAAYGKDVSRQGRLTLHPYLYYEDRQASLEVDFFGLQPLGGGEKARVALAHRDGAVVAAQDVAVVPERGVGEYAFDLASLDPGDYELRAAIEGPDRVVQAAVPFSYPAPPVAVPSPADVQVPPLPTPPPTPVCRVAATAGGGLLLDIDGHPFIIESAFSFPSGGDNKLVCAEAADTSGEPEWQVAPTPPDSPTCQVDARGKGYALARRVTAQPGRVVVSDTIANLTAEPLAILFTNRVTSRETAPYVARLGGREAAAPVSDRAVKTSPTAFLSAPGLGVGLVALDDVYIVQSRATFDGQGLALGSNEFALDAGASYTLEWAVYANLSGDYYDFVNAIRRDEGRNGVTVEGGFSCVPGSQHRRDASLVPAGEFFDVRNLRYTTLSCLSWCTDDPTISVEGIEFIEYPLERQRIREMMAAMTAVRPEVKGMFHVAHQLYATNRPEALFPDSRVLDAEGKQATYPYNYTNGAYFTKERVEENWRWWIYYPTLDNSFGRALLDSVDVMMDELGCRGVFVDGFLWGYGGEFTYDRWDGHTADVDPATKTITRKKGSVFLLTQDAMIAYCRKVWGKGGVVIANNIIPTRTVCAEPLIVDKEITEGPDVHLAPTPIAMGNPGAIANEVDVYRDVRNKLAWGNLYFYYGEPAALTYESVPKQMYPITVQEIHGGCVKGIERLITLNSGVYGWPGDRDLHLAYRYDARGHRIRPGFVTVADAASVRTQVTLDKDETAVLVRIPVRIECDAPVNVVVEQYDAQALSLALNGSGAVALITPDGQRRDFELAGPQHVHVP